MAFLSNLHGHSTFSDGASAMEEYVKAAISKNFVSLGFSEHAPVDCDKDDASILREDVPAYFAEFRRLKEAYAGQIELYLGLEVDHISPWDKSQLDFVVGSVHFLQSPEDGQYYTLDFLTEEYETLIRTVGGGDAYRMIGVYFDTLAALAESYRPDILGHMDLFQKLNKDNRYFTEEDPRFRAAAERAVERIASTGCVVEVNTGAISRGYRDIPYPSPYLLGLLHEKDVPLTISSDCHHVEHLDYWFGEAAQLLKKVGYRSVKLMKGGSFVDWEL